MNTLGAKSPAMEEFMRQVSRAVSMTAVFTMMLGIVTAAGADDNDRGRHYGQKSVESIQLGPRPFYLVEGMDEGPLKHRLMQCKDGPFRRTDFSIGHRGAALQFPEHTRESYEGGARQGAGIVECDVTFTKDGHLVCRHAENDLHTTTNILVTPLAEKCTKKFTAATFDVNGNRLTPASAECRTSDLTLRVQDAHRKMDASIRTHARRQSSRRHRALADGPLHPPRHLDDL
jgi:glycerophosphoryl diester phosphodiesterase